MLKWVQDVQTWSKCIFLCFAGSYGVFAQVTPPGGVVCLLTKTKKWVFWLFQNAISTIRLPNAPCRNVSVTIWYGRFSEILTFCCMSQLQRQETHTRNENCCNEVALYPMDLPWKIFWAKKNWKFPTFYFLNLSPALLIFGASWSKTGQLRRTKLFCTCILTTLITI